jgi:hypothetical protein
MTATARRPIVGHPIPVAIDLVGAGLVTQHDLDRALAVAETRARRVSLDGTQPDSTMERPEVALEYFIADGTVIAAELPAIMNMYRELIPAFMQTYIGLEMVPSRFERSAITLNLLRGQGCRYEKHVDSNSVTGLLFASTLTPEDGGALRLYYPGAEPMDIYPSRGTFLLYDARWVPHEVMPLLRDVVRLSLPMNYFLKTDIEVRPEHLDDYIFGESSS